MDMPTFEAGDIQVLIDVVRTFDPEDTPPADPVLPFEALRTAAKLLRYAAASDSHYRAWFHPADTPHCNTAGEINVESMADLLDEIAGAGGLQ